MTSRRLLPLLFLFLSFVGCVIPKPHPAADLPVVPGPSAIAVVREIDALADEVRGFRALGRLVVEKSIHAEELTQVVVFQRPDKLRVEFFEPNLTQLLALVMVSDNQIYSIDKQEKVAHRGTASARNLEKLLSVPLDPEAAMLWFVGRISVATNFEVRERAPGRFAIISPLPTPSEEVVAEYVREGGKNRIESLTLLRAGEELMRTEYSYELEGAAPLIPRVVTLKLPQQNMTATLTYDEPAVNPDLSKKAETLFRFPSAGEFPTVDLDRSVERAARTEDD